MSLIVFEGIDGSGKSTQFRLLCEHMDLIGQTYTRIQFPQYDKPSAAPLQQYLKGAYGTDPGAVNPYAASTFYAVDRFDSFKTIWGAPYHMGQMILADRYTTSNAVHQGAKLPKAERQAFFQWLDEFEHEKMELPKPNIVLYMDVPVEIAFLNILRRQDETGTLADIHEVGVDYLRACCEAAKEASEVYGWKLIRCTEDGAMRSEQEIHQEILGIIKVAEPR